MSWRKDATRSELDELWQKVCDYWDSLPEKIDTPWVEAAFKIEIFKSTLQQKGLRIPPEFVGGYARRF